MEAVLDSSFPMMAMTAIVGLALATYVPFKMLQHWAQGEYIRLCNDPKTECDIDAHVGAPEKNSVSALKVVAIQKAQLGSRKASLDPIPLECYDSPFIPGLYVTRRAGDKNEGQPDKAESLEDFFKKNSKPSKPIIVATIRMGFGHHRLA